MKMKILISYLFCTKGGVETAIANRLKTVNRSKYHIDLHFYSDLGGMPLFYGWKGKIFIESDNQQVGKIIKQEEYDVVIAIDSLPMLQVLDEIGYRGLRGLEVHTTYEEELKYLNRKEMANVQFVIVPSAYQKELVQGKLQGKKIYILGNAVDSFIDYKEDCIWTFQQKLILWVGRLDAHKNWRDFLKIAHSIYQNDTNTYFWMVGGLRSDPKEIDAFEKLIYKLELEQCIKWIPQVKYSEMSRIYSMTANSKGCYISTSRNESFGMTIVEAMKCRCPVIANNVGGMSELAADHRGLCLDNMTEPEQIQRIIDFIESDSKEEMVSCAQKYIDKNFSCDIIGKKFENILETIKAK